MTLRQYYEKVKDRSLNNENIKDIIDFNYHFCDSYFQSGPFLRAQFIGYYYRRVIDEEGRYYEDFPIARFLFDENEPDKPTNHKTFSLLPYQLIPNRKYSIPFLIKIMMYRCIDLMTVSKLQEYIFKFSSKAEGYVELSIVRIYSFKALIDEAITKLLSSGNYDEFKKHFQKESRMDRIRAFLDISLNFYCHKFQPPIRGPCGLSFDYFLKGGGYLKNQYFLFGTPSQFRLKRNR